MFNEIEQENILMKEELRTLSEEIEIQREINDEFSISFLK
jgi:hypothetical protein